LRPSAPADYRFPHEVTATAVRWQMRRGRSYRDVEEWLAELASANASDLRRRRPGTRWTKEQLLFHMLFGYLIVRPLLVLVRIFGRLPAPVSKAFAALLNLATGPFNVVNYFINQATRGDASPALVMPAAETSPRGSAGAG